MYQSKTKRVIALFVAIVMAASLFIATPVVAQETFNLGEFNYVGSNNWTHRWNTSNSDDNPGLVSMEDFVRATHLVVNLSGNPDTDVELIVFGDGNNWVFNQQDAWSPEDILEEGAYNFTIDLRTHPAWEAVIAGEVASIALGANGISNFLTSAHLVLGAATEVPTPRAEAPPVEQPPAEAPPVEAPYLAVPDPVAVDVPVADGLSVLQLTLGSTVYFLDGAQRTLEVAPYIEQGRTMVPLRFVAETLGAEVGWDSENQTATIDYGAISIPVFVGEPLTGADGYMGTPYIEAVANRTVVPLRFFVERLGADVDFIPPGTIIVVFGEEAVAEEPADEDDYDCEDGCCLEEYYDEYDCEDGCCADENGEDEADENGAEAVAEVEVSGYALRHTHGESWGMAMVPHAFTSDDYTAHLVFRHSAAVFGIDPAPYAAVGHNFSDVEGTRHESPAGVWTAHSFTFPGSEAEGALLIGTEYPRAPGSSFYLASVAIENSAGEVVFENDFETNLRGFEVREWSNDTQERVAIS